MKAHLRKRLKGRTIELSLPNRQERASLYLLSCACARDAMTIDANARRGQQNLNDLGVAQRIRGAKRASPRSVMSIDGRALVSSSATHWPAAGECWKPWPQKPMAR